MDTTDIAIIRRMTWKPFDTRDAGRRVAGPWDIARELELHGNTVKRRLARMQESGVLGGLHLIPETRVIGLDSALYAFTFPTSNDKQLGMDHVRTQRAGADTPGVLDSYTFVGDTAWVGIFQPAGGDLDAYAQRLGTEAGARDVRCIERRTWHVDAHKVTDLDRRIMKALHYDAFLPLATVAEQTGVTARTVRNRLQHLARLRAFALMPSLSPARMQGLIPFALHIRPGDPAVANRFFDAFPEAYFRSTPTAAVPHVFLAAVDLAEIDEAVVRAERVPGVEEATMRLFQDSVACVTDIAPVPAPKTVQPEAQRR